MLGASCPMAALLKSWSWLALLAAAPADAAVNVTSLDATTLLQYAAAGSASTPPASAGVCLVQDNRCADVTLGYSRSAAPQAIDSHLAQIVVTRMGEDVRWLDALPEIPALVYNRGGSSTLLPHPRDNLKVVVQANTGREDDEMLRHIITNYNDLPEYTIFLQGWPLLHCAGVVETVRRALGAQLSSNPAALGNGAKPGLVPLSRTFYEYSMSEGLLGLARSMTEAEDTGDDVMERALVLYARTCRQLLGRPCPDKHWVSEGAQWIVGRDRIRLRPLQTYLNALEMGEGYKGKFRGLVLEAIWPLLWGADNWNPKPSKVAPSDPVQLWSMREASTEGLTALLAPVGNGTASGAPDEAFCKRWWWTWVCDSAGLPASQHRRRRRRISGYYGGYSKTSMRATGSHCQAADGSDALTWSCEQRMAFCELQWHAEGTAQPKSNLFLNQRMRYHVHFHSLANMPSAGFLEMLVRLSMPMVPGSARAVTLSSEGDQLLMGASDARGTQFYLTDASMSSNPKQYIISLADSGSDPLYLGCDRSSRDATISPHRELWELMPAMDGYLRLKSEAGVLQYEPGKVTRLRCLPRADSDESIFSLHLDEHAPAAWMQATEANMPLAW